MPSFSLGMINSQLVVSPDSDIFSLWRHPPVNPNMKIYLFNLTNVDAWLNGSDAKLRVEEVGPWVYRETWMKKNITFHEYVDPMTPDPKYHEGPTNLQTILIFFIHSHPPFLALNERDTSFGYQKSLENKTRMFYLNPVTLIT